MEAAVVSKSRTRQVTLAAVFAAIYFVLRTIPTFQMVGISGRFTAGDFILTSIALIAGPWSGIVSVFVGTVLAYGVRPPLFLGLDFLPATINVLVASLLLSNRQTIARTIYAILLVAFVASPYSLLIGYVFVPYAWLHIVALIVMLSPVAAKIPSLIASTGARQVAAISLLAFFGTMAQLLTGGILYEATAGFIGGISPTSFREFWRVIFWLYPGERLLIVAFSTFIATALLRALRQRTHIETTLGTR